jgi:hypothetical protein
MFLEGYHLYMISVTLNVFSDDQASIQLEVYVDKRTAAPLNSGKEKIDDILVLHLEGGKDFFVSLITERTQDQTIIHETSFPEKIVLV